MHVVALVGALILSGLASWYSAESSGTRTSSGERMRDGLRTCAMRWVPFQTIVTVIDLESGRRVACRVNDRGPYVDGRIIDVSPAMRDALSSRRHRFGVDRVRVVIP